MNSIKYPGRFFLALLLTLSMQFSCSLDEVPAEGIRIRNLEISGAGENLPDAFPAFILFPGAKIIMTGIYDTGRTPEGVSYIHASEEINKVEDNYFKIFNESGWNIIQTHNNKNESLIMAESPFGKLITVILRENNGTDIKIYIKRLGSD